VSRLWRSLKSGCIYLNDLQTGSEAREAVARHLGCYNEERPHWSLGDSTPSEVYHLKQAA